MAEFLDYRARLGSDFPRVWFHDLRHSQVTQPVLAGVHPKVAQDRLGHSTVTTTLDLYSSVTATMREDAAGRLDAASRGAIRAIGEKSDRRAEMKPSDVSGNRVR